MIESITVRVGIPAKALSPNARVHHMAKARVRKKQREAAFFCAKAAMGNGEFGWAAAKITTLAYFRRKFGTGWDKDNLIASMKGAVDGLVDAGLLLNDDKVEWGEVNIVYGDKDPRVELVVRRLSTPA